MERGDDARIAEVDVLQIGHAEQERWKFSSLYMLPAL